MHYTALKQALTNQDLIVVITVIGGPQAGQKLLLWDDGRIEGKLDLVDLERISIDYAQIFIERQQSGRHSFTINDETHDLFFDLYLPQPKLIIIGAVHIAVPLVTFAKMLGYHTVVVDARGAFATHERFPHADQLIHQWPDEALEQMTIDESTCIVTLTHDEKLDNPALLVALQSKARYIGALGSSSTHAKRVAALTDLGATPAQLARIHGPIGLNIGAVGPQEIALAIAAELVQTRRQG